jgi:hypothetical protein
MSYDVRKDDGFDLLKPDWQEWVLHGDTECDCSGPHCSRCCSCPGCQGIRLEDLMQERGQYPEAFK